MIPRDTRGGFLSFKFLRFLLTFSVFWDLTKFGAEIQANSKSNLRCCSAGERQVFALDDTSGFNFRALIRVL